MSRNRKSRIIIIFLLLLSIFGISAAFAILSQELKISTLGQINSNIWSIVFENLEHTTTNGGVNENSVIVSGTTINLSASFVNPGDKVNYTFDVVNKGTLNAQLHTIVINGDFDLHPDIKFDFSYNNDSDYGNAVPDEGDSLAAGQSRPLQVEIKFDENASYVTKEDRTSNFVVHLIYVQEDLPSDAQITPPPEYEGAHPLVAELYSIQHFVSSQEASRLAARGTASEYYIGTALSSDNYIDIEGINYWKNWYLVTASDLQAVGIDATYAPYIVRYNSGAVQSIPGAIVDDNIIHTLNYTGEGDDQLYIIGLLSAVDSDSTKNDTSWGQMTIVNGVAQYDTPFEGLILGEQIAVLDIDQSKPVNQKFSINVTVKGSVPQTIIETFPRTIVAISDQSGSYLSWIGIRGQYLHIYSFYPASARASIDKEETVAGFTSIDLMKSAYGFNFNNNFLNLQVTAELNGLTRVYINGDLFKTFDSGSGELTYGKLTVGDLRSGRNLKYNGSIYNLALYSDVLSENAIKQNWEYAKYQLGIE